MYIVYRLLVSSFWEDAGSPSFRLHYLLIFSGPESTNLIYYSGFSPDRLKSVPEFIVVFLDLVPSQFHLWVLVITNRVNKGCAGLQVFFIRLLEIPTRFFRNNVLLKSKAEVVIVRPVLSYGL